MTTYEISAARLLDSRGDEFLVISIPPEHYAVPEIRDRYFEQLEAVGLSGVIVSATSAAEWSIRSTALHLLHEMEQLKVEQIGWHRMAVTSEAAPW